MSHLAMDCLQQQVRYAWRALTRSKAFTAIATLILALGLGASATVFSVVDAAFLKPLPYPHADRLQMIESSRKSDRISVSYPDLLDWRGLNHVYVDLAGFTGQTSTFAAPGTAADIVRGQMITPNLFRMLGVRPARGRDFVDAEFAFGSPKTVIVSHGLWVRRFAADPAIVGRLITIDRELYEVVGVMPSGFDFPGASARGPSEFWIPTGLADRRDFENRDSHPGLTAVARLKDNVSPEAAKRDMEAVAARLREQFPASNKDEGVYVSAALDSLVGDLKPALTLVSVAVLALLLITAANMTGLLLARAVAGHRDIAIRTALGASRARIVGQLLMESVCLSLFGGVIGIGIAFVSIRLLRSRVADMPRLGDMTLDGRVVAFALGLSLFTGVIFGVGPALAATGKRIDAWLRNRGESTTLIGTRTRRILVTGEIVVSCVLAVCASMLGRSLAHLVADQGGVQPDGALTFTTRLPEGVYERGPRATAFYQEMLTRIAALPGVTAVGAISTLPFSGFGAQSGISAMGSTDEPIRTDVAAATPGYFAAAGMTLVRGRLLTEADQDSLAIPVGVIDEQLARRTWPNADPIGQQLQGWGLHVTVVGVVRHVKNYGVAEESRQELYVPLARRPMTRMYTVVRTHGEPGSMTAGIRAIIASIDPDVPLAGVRTLRNVVDATIATPRLTSMLSGVFAATSLLLSAVGLYGLLAFLVGQRTHEMGVRMALGASPSVVMRLVIGHAAGLVVAGLGVGLVASLGAGQLLRSRLFGVAPADPLSLCLVPLAFVAVTALAAWIPARRAARIDPVEALRR